MNTEKKHLIIAGVPRSGKSTVCSRLAMASQYQHLEMDAVTKAFEDSFPETGVTHTDYWNFLETSKNMIPFTKSLAMNSNYDKFSYRLVLDLYHITPKDYYENIDSNCCSIYFLGYPNISIEEKLQQIRTFDTPWDWTSRRDDDCLKRHLTTYIEISKWLEDECKKYHLPFLDVSHDRETLLNTLIETILSQ